MRDVVVVGAGLHRYGVFPDQSATALGTVAIQRALDDAGCQWTDMDAVYCGTVRLGMSAGHTICRHMGTTGLAITNVENASASGSSALREAYLAVAAAPGTKALRRWLCAPARWQRVLRVSPAQPLLRRCCTARLAQRCIPCSFPPV